MTHMYLMEMCSCLLSFFINQFIFEYCISTMIYYIHVPPFFSDYRRLNAGDICEMGPLILSLQDEAERLDPVRVITFD